MVFKYVSSFLTTKPRVLLEVLAVSGEEPEVQWREGVARQEQAHLLS